MIIRLISIGVLCFYTSQNALAQNRTVIKVKKYKDELEKISIECHSICNNDFSDELYLFGLALDSLSREMSGFMENNKRIPSARQKISIYVEKHIRLLKYRNYIKGNMKHSLYILDKAKKDFFAKYSNITKLNIEYKKNKKELDLLKQRCKKYISEYFSLGKFNTFLLETELIEKKTEIPKINQNKDYPPSEYKTVPTLTEIMIEKSKPKDSWENYGTRIDYIPVNSFSSKNFQSIFNLLNAIQLKIVAENTSKAKSKADAQIKRLEEQSEQKTAKLTLEFTKQKIKYKTENKQINENLKFKNNEINILDSEIVNLNEILINRTKELSKIEIDKQKATLANNQLKLTQLNLSRKLDSLKRREL